MPGHFFAGRLRPLLFSRKSAAVAGATALAIVLGSIGCMGLDTTSRNATQSHEGSLTIPPNSTVEVTYPTPFASPPTVSIFAWHSDWKIVEQNEKSFKIFNKNAAKPRSVEWKARGLRVMPPPPKTEIKVISTPLIAPAGAKQQP
jgi:hypothetical protein